MRWIWFGMAAATAIFSLPLDIADRAWLADPGMWLGLPLIGSVALDLVVILGCTGMWWVWR